MYQTPMFFSLGPPNFLLLFTKLTWPPKVDLLKMYLLLKINISIAMLVHQKVKPLQKFPYCWWLKSQTTTWDVWNPINNGKNYQPQLVNAGFQPSTVASKFSKARLERGHKGIAFRTAAGVGWILRWQGGPWRSVLEGGFKGVGGWRFDWGVWKKHAEKWWTNERSFCRNLVENKSRSLRKFASTFIQLCLACTSVFFSGSFW